jgi:integrase
MISARNAFLAIYTRMVASLVVAVNVGMRQTALALALTLGVSPKVVSEQLGHTSAAFTLNVYSHVLPHMQEDAAAKVEAAFMGH